MDSMDFESITQSRLNFDDFGKFNARIGISSILVELDRLQIIFLVITRHRRNQILFI